MRVLLLLLLAVSIAAAASPARSPKASSPPRTTSTQPPYQAGWTPETVDQMVAECGEQLVQGAWHNTLRREQMPEDQALTPEIRQQLAPQIAAFQKVCDCTVRRLAARWDKHAWDTQRPEMDRYAVELVEKGICPLPKRKALPPVAAPPAATKPSAAAPGEKPLSGAPSTQP
jgi:hypothetical protein